MIPQLFIPHTVEDLKSDKTQQLWHFEEMVYKYVYLGRMYIQEIYNYLFWMIPKAIINCWGSILYGIKESFLLKVVQFRVENNIMSVILISYCLSCSYNPRKSHLIFNLDIMILILGLCNFFSCALYKNFKNYRDTNTKMISSSTPQSYSCNKS